MLMYLCLCSDYISMLKVQSHMGNEWDVLVMETSVLRTTYVVYKNSTALVHMFASSVLVEVNNTQAKFEACPGCIWAQSLKLASPASIACWPNGPLFSNLLIWILHFSVGIFIFCINQENIKSFLFMVSTEYLWKLFASIRKAEKGQIIKIFIFTNLWL